MGRTPSLLSSTPPRFSGFNASLSITSRVFWGETGLEGPLSGRPPPPPSSFKEDGGARPRVSVFFSLCATQYFPGVIAPEFGRGGKVG